MKSKWQVHRLSPSDDQPSADFSALDSLIALSTTSDLKEQKSSSKDKKSSTKESQHDEKRRNRRDAKTRHARHARSSARKITQHDYWDNNAWAGTSKSTQGSNWDDDSNNRKNKADARWTDNGNAWDDTARRERRNDASKADRNGWDEWNNASWDKRNSNKWDEKTWDVAKRRRKKDPPNDWTADGSWEDWEDEKEWDKDAYRETKSMNDARDAHTSPSDRTHAVQSAKTVPEAHKTCTAKTVTSVCPQDAASAHDECADTLTMKSICPAVVPANDTADATNATDAALRHVEATDVNDLPPPAPPSPPPALSQSSSRPMTPPPPVIDATAVEVPVVPEAPALQPPPGFGDDDDSDYVDFETLEDFVVLEVGHWAVVRPEGSDKPSYWNVATDELHVDMPDIIRNADLNFDALARMHPPTQNIVHRHRPVQEPKETVEIPASDKQIWYLRVLCRRLGIADETISDSDILKSKIQMGKRIEDLRKLWEQIQEEKGAVEPVGEVLLRGKKVRRRRKKQNVSMEGKPEERATEV